MFTERDSHRTTAIETVRYRWQLQSKERAVPACLSYIIEGDRIRLPGNPAGVKFDFPIGDVVETQDTIVICLRVPEGSSGMANVYALDYEGKKLWSIASQSSVGHGSYVALSVHGTVISLHTINGDTYKLNLEDGSRFIEDRL